MAEATKVYELTVLFHPDLESRLGEAEAKLEKIIKDDSAKIIKTESWGKKKLAYPINKQEFAIYKLYDVEASPSSSNHIQSVFNITDDIIRYLMVEKDPRMDEEDKKPAGKATKEQEDS